MKKAIGILIMYLPFVFVLVISFFTLFHEITTNTNELERNICIWTEALWIIAAVGGIGGLVVLACFNRMLTGKTPNIVQDIIDENSQDVAVEFNGFIGSTLLISAVGALYIVSFYVQRPIIASIASFIAVLFTVGSVAYIIALYLKTKSVSAQSLFSKLADPAILPAIFCIFQMLIIKKKTVGFVYCNICSPENEFILAIVLIVILCYVLVVAYCFFDIIYCMIGFLFRKRSVLLCRQHLERLNDKAKWQDALLRQTAEYVDKKAMQYHFVKRLSLAANFYFIHIKVYIQNRLDAIFYVLATINYRITKRFNGLLEPDRIRINGIRFCLLVAVIELLSLNLVLSVYLESDSACLKFFELLSTVVIIPILLSWLTEIKEQYKSKNETEVKEK